MLTDDFLTNVSNNAEISGNAGSTDIDNSTFMGYLSDDDRNSILSSYEGGTFNENHDVVNDKGEVLLSAEDFRTRISEHLAPSNVSLDDLSSITIDETEYSINENGEAIDAEGKVVKTREELEAIIAEQNGEETIDDINTLIQEAAIINGLDYTDANGNVVEFENSVNGLVARDNFLIDKYGREIATTAIDTMFAKMPEVRQVYEHLSLHGNLDNFSFGATELNIELEDGNDVQHADLITRYQTMLGNAPETAALMAKMFVEDGKGLEQAKIALDKINNSIRAQGEARTRQLEAKQLQEKQDQLDTFNSIKSIVDSGKIGEFTIPPIIKTKDAEGRLVQKNRNDFLAYYTSPDVEGKTQYQKYMDAKSTEDKLVEALIAFTGNDRQSLLDSSVNTKRIKLNTKRNTSGSGGNRKPGTPTGGINHRNVKI